MVIIFSILLAIPVVGFFAVYTIARLLASKGYQGPPSDHFDGERFYSYGKPGERSLPPEGKRQSFWTWVLFRPKNRWVWKPNAHTPVLPARVEGREVLVTFVNHASVLIQTEGLNILTDPVWSKRASPFRFIGPKRHRPPGVEFEHLPKIDLLLLSHNHYDHMDLATLRRINKKWAPKIVTGLGNMEYLASQGIPGARELDWWDEASLLSGLKIVCVPGQHFSARSIGDRNKTLWCGFVVETPHGRIYFAGDTGYGEWVEKIKERYGSFRLAFLPIGAYLPAWFMSSVHLSPDEALAVHRELGIETSVAIHWGTFRLADDGQDQAAERMRELAAPGNLPESFKVLDNGEQLRLT